MATGLSANPKEEETETIQTQNWEEIRTNFTFYSLRNSNLSVAEQISGFLNEAAPDDVINNMLAKMQSVALPALIEAITENFVPETFVSRRRYSSPRFRIWCSIIVNAHLPISPLSSTGGTPRGRINPSHRRRVRMPYRS